LCHERREEGGVVTEAKGVPRDSTESAGEAALWNQDRQKFERTRLERVQASARVWLGVLTTLLGLLGSVVLFKGGALVTEVTASGPFQAILIVLVGLVFAVTVLAVIFGGQATWGGLAIATQQAGTEAAVTEAAVTLGPVARTADPRPLRRRAWFTFATSLALWSQPRGSSRRVATDDAKSSKPPWMAYRDWSLSSAERRRVYLHASRAAGVAAAGLIALLAIVAVIAGTISPVPTEVIVVHHGRLSCGPASGSKMFTGVTQVVPVSSC
jgi:hypothetical protein